MEAISRLVEDCQLLEKESALCSCLVVLFLYLMFDFLDSRFLYAVNKWCKCVITLNMLCLRRLHLPLYGFQWFFHSARFTYKLNKLNSRRDSGYTRSAFIQMI